MKPSPPFPTLRMPIMLSLLAVLIVGYTAAASPSLPSLSTPATAQVSAGVSAGQVV
ncbi:MAG: hypothetical protein ABL909_02200 [Sphingopyxis sp.]